MEDWNGVGPLPTLYSRTATGAVNVWTCWVDGDEVRVSWGQLNGAMQESSQKCLPKNEGRSNATTAHEQAVKEAKALWKKKIKKKYNVSLEAAGETVRFKPMLALDIKKRNQKKPLQFPVFVQPKLDGVRCIAYRSAEAGGRLVLQSRGGDFWDVEHIRQELERCVPPGLILDGELYIHGMSLQKITSLVKRPQPGSEELWYCVYDMTTEDHNFGTFHQRHNSIRGFFQAWGETLIKVIEVPTAWTTHEELMRACIHEHELAGYEGGIVRTTDGLYVEDLRSPDLLKVKNWEDSEFKVVGWAVGRGKHEFVPVFKCLTEDGKEFEVTPKGSAAERYEMLQQADSFVGHWLKVQFLGRTEDGKPKCARGLAIRYPEDM